MKKKKKFVRFWINTSKQFEASTILELPYNISREEIDDKLLDWCRNVFTRFDTTESFIRYGFKTIKMLPRKELLKKWKIVCEQKRKIDERHKLIREMLAVT